MVEVTSVRGDRLSGFGYDDASNGSEAARPGKSYDFSQPKKIHIKLTTVFKEFEMRAPATPSIDQLLVLLAVAEAGSLSVRFESC